MSKTTKNAKQFLSGVVLVAMVFGLGFGWVKLRQEVFRPLDALWLGVGSISMLWIVLWAYLVRNTKTTHSLIVPYAPIFVIPALGMIATKLGLLANLELMNLMVFFLIGYLGTVPVIVLFGKLSSPNSK